MYCPHNLGQFKAGGIYFRTTAVDAQVHFLLVCQICNCYLLPVNGFSKKPPCGGRLSSVSRKVMDKILQNKFTKQKNCDIIRMLHKLNIRINGILTFIGIFVPFFAITIFELGKIASSTKWLWLMP